MQEEKLYDEVKAVRISTSASASPSRSVVAMQTVFSQEGFQLTGKGQR